jgi:hypothetical protein
MCKKLIVLVFCSLVLFSGAAMAEVDDSGRLIVPGASVAPIIDGELDDVWQNVGEEGVLITEIINTTSAVPEDASDLSGTFKVMHDADNFYIYVVIQDSVIDYEFSDWNGDGVELFFDGDNSKGSSYDGVNDNQIRITVDDVELANIDSSLPVDGSAFKVILTDLGYNIEASFPLETLQIVPETTFGFEVQINDNDGGGGRETMIRWFSNDNNSWQDASLFGEAVLAGISEAPVTIPVTNAGFEDPVLAEDDWTWLDVPGWTWVGGEGPGIWHVTSADFDPVVAPEGQNVLYTENAVGDAGGVAQVLTETFAANTDYTLTAEVGNSYYYYFAGYSVQLLAGGTVIAEDNDTLWPDYTKWATSTVQYTYDSADSALVGQPLEIRLLNLGLDKDNPTDNIVGVEFDNVTLSYDAGAEPGVTITVEAGGDIAAANEMAKAGDVIEIAAGTFSLTSQIEIKDGVTYRGAGPGLTIIDGGDVTRAFVAWGDRSFNEGNENPNDSGPKGWVLEGMTIQNCVADTNDRFSYAGAAFNMLDDFADNDADASGGLNPDEADADAGAIRLPGADGAEGTEDDDLHRFAAMDADGNGELSEAELNAQLLSTEDEFGDEAGDGGAIFIGNQAAGTIENCEFLNNHTPIPGDGDDGGAINITGLSVVTINDCWFEGNYACSPNAVSESDETGDADGDGGHIKVQGGSASAITPGTTLIANRCVFLNGRAEDDGAAVQSSAVGSIIRLDACWFEGNTAADDGTVLFIGNESSGELTVTNCVFANNISSAASDRMCQVRRNSKFINCTFVGNNQDDQDMIYNNADSADTDADGVDDEIGDATEVVNCIFGNNVVGDGDDVLGSRNNDFTIAATNCIFFGNTLQNGNAADNTQRPDVETGSIMDDPLLDAEYVPVAGSLAVDGGVDPATVGVTLTTDYNGDARPQGAAYDIGAFEFGVENLVQNPSFEEDEAVLDDPDWAMWCTWNPAEGAGSNAMIVDTESIDGAKSLRIEPIGAENWHFIVLNLPIPLEVGKNYTASFWVKAEAARPLGAQMKATDNSISWGYTDFQLTTEWAEYTFSSDAENAEGKLEIFCAGSEVPFWLDLVSVCE